MIASRISGIAFATSIVALSATAAPAADPGRYEWIADVERPHALSDLPKPPTKLAEPNRTHAPGSPAKPGGAYRNSDIAFWGNRASQHNNSNFDFLRHRAKHGQMKAR
jgi:hypothetical protein